MCIILVSVKIHEVTFSTNPCILKLKDIDRNIPDIDKYQIFQYKNKNLFSNRIEKKNASNCINEPNDHKKCDLKICSIIIGHSFNFSKYDKYDLDIRFAGGEAPIKEDGEKFVAEIKRSYKESGLIGTCMIKSYKVPNYDSTQSKVITSIHFHEKEEKARVYAYDLVTKKIVS